MPGGWEIVAAFAEGWRFDQASRWSGGRGRDRTADFLGVNEALCQLSYAPTDSRGELS